MDGTTTIPSGYVTQYIFGCFYFSFVRVSESIFLQELEKKRKERAQIAYERKKQLTKLRVKAEKIAEEKLGAELEVIAPIKY